MTEKNYSLKQLSHYPVNWIDGMKVSRKHFLQMDDAFADQLRDTKALHINHLNYGLLSPAKDHHSSLEIEIQIDAQNIIQCSLKTCRAVTGDGVRIEILNSQNKSTYSAAQINAQYQHDGQKDAVYAVIVYANIFERMPIGEPDAEEQPIRHPFTAPKVLLDIIPFEQLDPSEGHYLVLTKLIYSEGKWSKDESSIPPCVAVQNHKKLYEAYVSLGNQLGEIGSFCTNIVQKVKGEKQKTSLSLNIQEVSEKMISFLADKIVFYRWLNSQRPPVYVVENFVSLAYCIKTSFDCLTEKDREEMFKYFEQWTNLKPVEFDNQLQEVLKIQYEHNDIAVSMNGVIQFMNMLTQLFGKLSKLKFIGEQPDAGIVLGETIEPKKAEKKSGWSFLAD